MGCNSKLRAATAKQKFGLVSDALSVAQRQGPMTHEKGNA
jgi:hypothetical protein